MIEVRQAGLTSGNLFGRSRFRICGWCFLQRGVSRRTVLVTGAAASGGLLLEGAIVQAWKPYVSTPRNQRRELGEFGPDDERSRTRSESA
jgi:hypothetical protein